MFFLRNLFCAALFLMPVFLSAQIEPGDAKYIFRELRVLDGTWFMPTDRGDRLEIWRVADDSTLIGRTIRIKPENGDTVTLENLRIELRGDTVTYVAIARGQNNNQPVRFVLTNADYEGYLFENPAHDDPQKIRYRLLGRRELQVTTEGKKGTRTIKNEFVFEREFAPGAMQFRVRGGINAQNLRKTGYFLTDKGPEFAWRPGWELGAQATFKGRGGFITMNIELNLTSRHAHAVSEFARVYKGTMGQDSAVFYKRDLTYGTTWLGLALLPEITLKRDGKLSVLAGPYLGRLVSSHAKGLEEPANENKLFKANNDFKKTELGLVLGLQYKMNFGKKDLDGILGIRGNLGLSNIDNLYPRGIQSTALANGQISFIGAALYYSINLLKL